MRDDRGDGRIHQDLHLQSLEPASQGLLAGVRAGACAQVDHGLGIPAALTEEAGAQPRLAMVLQKRPGRFGQRGEDGVPANPPEPVSGIAGVWLATMADPMHGLLDQLIPELARIMELAGHA